MNFPFLSVITFTPLVAALLILLLPAQRKNEARAVALGCRGLCPDPVLLGVFQLRSGSRRVINSLKDTTGFPRSASACTSAWMV